MDEECARFRELLLNEIRADTQAGADYARTRFIDRACAVLEAGEEFTEYHICRAHTETRKGGQVKLDAYSFSPSDGVLNLVVCEYSGVDEPEPLMTEEVRRIVQSGYRFLEGSVYDTLADRWDESHPAYALAREVFSFASGEMTKVRLYLISDRPLGMQLGRMPELALGAQQVEIQLWDVCRLARMEASSLGREDIEIDFVSDYGCGIPALSAGLDGATRYQSFMCVMPGIVLAELYKRFGGRILEQNVRAFLGEGRKVNKGIRETLRDEPTMFFAFNNGLTVTVSDVTLARGEDGHTLITAAKGLQVVNGGQTTASLHWARQSGVDLSHVYVQMKLSLLPAEGFEDAVHNIARFANAQTAVSASDLFAGHAYFKRLEGLSRQTLAPPAKAGEINSYWFFERTTGSYKVDLKRKSGMAANAWQLIHPKRQILTKTDIARYEMTFSCQPHLVSSGAQKNIAAFGKDISKRWDADPETFDIEYFKQMVVKAILTRAVDSLIPAQPWYPGSILRPLSSYTLALMSLRMQQLDRQLDYEAIWRAQKAPPMFIDEAMRIASEILPLVQEIPEEQVRNRLVTEWVKKEACWKRVEVSDIELSQVFCDTLAGGAVKRQVKVGWKTRAYDLWRQGSLKRLHEWNQKTQLLTPGEAELVGHAAIAREFRLKGFRLTKLQEAWDRAVDQGFV
jgi:hypothetical protein